MKLAVLVPRARLHPAVLAWADENAARREHWAVAFSGGADSLALLLLLWAHWPERRARLRALHFDHRLRGAESRADAMFCGKVCVALGVKLIAGEWSAARRGASEAEARAARMAFFREHSLALWLGHQQDDIAETMLMRLARGSGTAGLAAPRPVQPMPRDRVHLRPLLTLKKAEIIAALSEAGAAWREDASNAGDAYFRNRVRHEVVAPWQAAAQRDALAGAALARELLEEDAAALDQWLAESKVFTSTGALRLGVLKKRPKAIARRALRQWLARQTGAEGLSRQAVDTLLEDVRRGAPMRRSLGREAFAVIRGGLLRRETGVTVRRTTERKFR